MPLCRGWRDGRICGSDELIEAHLIARSFGRALKRPESKHNIVFDRLRVKPAQLGVYDKSILCADCDNFLGKYDSYAHSFIKKFSPLAVKIDEDTFSLDALDDDQFSRFVLSVLRRCSISNRPEVEELRLGPIFEKKIRRIIFEGCSVKDNYDFQIILQYYKSPHFSYSDIRRFYTIPVKSPMLGLTTYLFALNGFRIVAKLDARPFPAQLKHYIVGGERPLYGTMMELEKTGEFEAITNNVVADFIRKGTKPPGVE